MNGVPNVTVLTPAVLTVEAAVQRGGGFFVLVRDHWRRVVRIDTSPTGTRLHTLVGPQGPYQPADEIEVLL